MKTFITDPFNPIVEMQTEEGVSSYSKRLSELSRENLCVEFSNVMTAKHNLMLVPTGLNEYQEKQSKVTDLTDKALWICVFVFGAEPILNFNGNDASTFNQLITTLDEKVAKLDLPPEQHGSELLSNIGRNLIVQT